MGNVSLPAVLPNAEMNNRIISTCRTILIVQLRDNHTVGQTSAARLSVEVCPNDAHALAKQAFILTALWGGSRIVGSVAVGELQHTSSTCTQTHPAWHKGSAKMPQSVPHCCSYEKFTHKWSHPLFWAHLWPKSVLKSSYLSLTFCRVCGCVTASVRAGLYVFLLCDLPAVFKTHKRLRLGLSISPRRGRPHWISCGTERWALSLIFLYIFHAARK